MKMAPGFCYRIDIRWRLFSKAGFVALLVALTTVSFQAIKSATENPVDSLKYE